jgi:tryptophan 2,3-dioxygenase
MEISPELQKRLDMLQVKYAVSGQDMLSYIDGLLHADFLTYWGYINLDTLLSLQQPRTPIPDEEIFIIYHQITELYFKLIIKAIRQVAQSDDFNLTLYKRQLKRINDYFEQLIGSFGVMIEGMDRHEFLKFRMSLLPASGFQSAQYRFIELISTDLKNLVQLDKRADFQEAAKSIDETLPYLYWRSGATELATGKKTLTLEQFELKYASEFERLANEFESCNLAACYQKLSTKEQADPELIALMRQHDLNANVRWNLQHYRSAVRYLDKKPQEIAATGGTNWQKYLPPRFQRVIFYPFLWSNDEQERWGTFGF